MSDCFAQKSGRVVVVDASGPVRQMMTDVVRGLGFEDVQSRPSINETMQFLEAETADWLIIPLMADQPVNGLHMLKTCSEVPQLKTIRISLLVADDERFVIPTAFELGALSWHPKPFTKESLGSELTNLLTVMSGYQHNQVLTAANYLRAHLQAEKDHAAQIALEKGLLDLYPGDANILLNLVEPSFHLDRKPQARATLNQVKMINPDLAGKADELGKRLFPDGGAGSDAAGADDVNVLGVKSCVLIDSDDTVCRAVEDILKGVGIDEVKKFSSGVEAWQALESGPEPELIIMEWRIPKLTGPVLVQKIRNKFATAPVVVLSSLLKSNDMPLVREMGVANVLSKPLHREIFLPGLIHTVQQERLPTDHQAMERKIRHALAAGQTDEAERLKAQFLAAPDVPLARKRQIEAEAAFYANNFTMARDAGIESLKLAGDSIIILNLLGKTFMRLADYNSALKCFKKAQDMSPHNVERLCNIAEVNTELGDDAAANAALEGAKSLDPDAKAVADAEVKIAIANGDVASAKSLMGEMESLSGLVAYMNNKAVAHAKCGLVEEAMDMYRKTVQSIPDDKADTKAIVQYNLALALIKASDFAAAKEELEQVAAVSTSKVNAKAKSLLQRLQASMEKGASLHLRQAGTDAPAASSPEPKEGGEDATTQLSTEEDHARLMAMVEARKGDLCCYLVYNHPNGRDGKAGTLLLKQPRFQMRAAVEREEAMGAERLNKGA